MGIDLKRCFKPVGDELLEKRATGGKHDEGRMKNLTNVQQTSLLNLISEEKSRLKEKADKERDPRMAQGYQDGADFWNPIYEYIKNLPVNPDEDVQRHLDKIYEGIHKKH